MAMSYSTEAKTNILNIASRGKPTNHHKNNETQNRPKKKINKSTK